MRQNLTFFWEAVNDSILQFFYSTRPKTSPIFIQGCIFSQKKFPPYCKSFFSIQKEYMPFYRFIRWIGQNKTFWRKHNQFSVKSIEKIEKHAFRCSIFYSPPPPSQSSKIWSSNQLYIHLVLFLKTDCFSLWFFYKSDLGISFFRNNGELVRI